MKQEQEQPIEERFCVKLFGFRQNRPGKNEAAKDEV